MKAKIFDGEYGKLCKINVELEVYIEDDDLDVEEDDLDVEEDDLDVTDEDVKNLLGDMERIDLGEMVLNNLHKATVVTE